MSVPQEHGLYQRTVNFASVREPLCLSCQDFFHPLDPTAPGNMFSPSLDCVLVARHRHDKAMVSQVSQEQLRSILGLLRTPTNHFVFDVVHQLPPTGEEMKCKIDFPSRGGRARSVMLVCLRT